MLLWTFVSAGSLVWVWTSKYAATFVKNMILGFKDAEAFKNCSSSRVSGQ